LEIRHLFRLNQLGLLVEIRWVFLFQQEEWVPDYQGIHVLESLQPVTLDLLLMTMPFRNRSTYQPGLQVHLQGDLDLMNLCHLVIVRGGMMDWGVVGLIPSLSPPEDSPSLFVWSSLITIGVVRITGCSPT
jgi:hypothetical protein